MFKERSHRNYTDGDPMEIEQLSLKDGLDEDYLQWRNSLKREASVEYCINFKRMNPLQLWS